MLYQSRQLKQKKTDRSFQPRYSHLNQQMDNENPNAHYSKVKFARVKTEQATSGKTDSLQDFQDEVNSMLKSISSIRNRSEMKKRKNYFPTIRAGQSSAIHENSISTQIRSQVNAIKNLLQQQKTQKPSQKNQLEDKLSKIVMQLEHQRELLKIETQRVVRSRNRSEYAMPPVHQPMQPIIMTPPPQYMYPPPYYPYQHQKHHTQRRKRRNMWKDSPETQQSQDDILYDQKKRTERQPVKDYKKVLPKKKSKYNRIKILFLAVYYFVCLRNQAKKSALARRKNLEKDCKDNLFAEMATMKNWLLQSNKTALSVILQKKSLNFIFFDDKSAKIAQQKQNLVLFIVNNGLTSLLQNCRKQKIQGFRNMIKNLCMHRSYPIHNFWTESEMRQLPISEAFGFFKLDSNLQKFAITLVIFVKVLIFNMLLQPTKFDKINFAKGEQPLKSNLKLISSTYYLMAKQLALDYLNEPRNTTQYKAGNFGNVKLSKAKCSQPLIYDNAAATGEEFIEGLFDEEKLYDLRVHPKWTACLKKMKEVVEKVHSIVKASKGKKLE